MKLYQTLEKQLTKETNNVTDNGELKKWVVINKAQNYDAELIGLLLEEPELKAKFFIDIKGILVFNQALFIQFLEQKNYLNNSFTTYKNKVGLTINGKYLKQRNEVELVWPFKDCILEGGQSREEDKREEIFFNETLAQDEITQLLDPKVFTNANHYTTEGQKPLDKFNRNEQGVITDNLIIKGNNLLALHSLKEEFAGKVKLIYIDPPYNTGSDSFHYNDSFNRSTWLTFMKNRIEAAKLLLTEDGLFYIQTDNNEFAYLKIICDEIFIDGFLQFVSVKKATTAGFKAINFCPITVTEYILVYAKNKKMHKSRFVYKEAQYNEDYNRVITNKEELPEKWIIESLDNIILKESKYNDWKECEKEFGKYWKEIRKEMKSKYAYENKDIVISTKDLHKPSQTIKDKMELSKINRNKVFEIKRDGIESIYMYNGRSIAFYATKFKIVDGVNTPSEPLTNFWDDISWYGIGDEGHVELKNGKKPEKLVKRIIDLSTEENDIVLDYHLGSGTTAAVAHKLNRQYIGIEQLNYGDNDSVIRIKNVIAGDTTGISRAVNWQGGGSFVYLELKKYNQAFIEQIEGAKSTPELLTIWEAMKAKSFLNYNVDIKKQEAHIEEFKHLTLAEQKQHLVELLDKNQLYVNLSSLNDSDFACTEHEKSITKAFYHIKENK